MFHKVVYRLKSTVRVHYRPLAHSCAHNLRNEYIVDCCSYAERVHFIPERYAYIFKLKWDMHWLRTKQNRVACLHNHVPKILVSFTGAY